MPSVNGVPATSRRGARLACDLTLSDRTTTPVDTVLVYIAAPRGNVAPHALPAVGRQRCRLQGAASCVAADSGSRLNDYIWPPIAVFRFIRLVGCGISK